MDLFHNISLFDFLLHALYNLLYIYAFYTYYDINIRKVRNNYNENFINIVDKIQDLEKQIFEINNNIKLLYNSEKEKKNKIENIISNNQLLYISNNEIEKKFETISKKVNDMYYYFSEKGF